ncbi:MAG: hypothetical protein NUV57_05955 [archaeon]|nr:hypothetical protein [archaeon]
MKTELKRQIIHILVGALYALIAYFLPKEQFFILLLAIFGTGSFLSYIQMKTNYFFFLQNLISTVERTREKHIPGRAALSFTLGILISSIVFYQFEKIILIGAIITLTFGDGFSAIIGNWIGKHKIFGNKTFEGTIGGIIAATIVLTFFFPIEIALPAAIFAMLAEYIPINDNYVIPIVSGLVLGFLI